MTIKTFSVHTSPTRIDDALHDMTDGSFVVVAAEVFDHPNAIEDGNGPIGPWVLGPEDEVRAYIAEHGWEEYDVQYSAGNETTPCDQCGEPMVEPFTSDNDSGLGFCEACSTRDPEEEITRRWASPQSWRRLRKSLTESEARDIARDIADAMPVGSPAEIFHALWEIDWSIRRQG